MKIFCLNIVLLLSIFCQAQTPILMIPRGHGGDAKLLAVSANGNWLASGSDDGTLKLWDIKNSKEIKTYTNFSAKDGYKKIAKVLAFNPNNKTLLVASYRELRIIDMLDGNVVFKKDIHDFDIDQIVFSTDGKLLVTTSRSAGEIKVWNTEGMLLLKTVNIKENEFIVRFGGGDQLTLFTKKSMSFLDINSFEVVSKKSLDFDYYQSSISPDGRYIVKAYNSELQLEGKPEKLYRVVTVIDTRSGKLVKTFYDTQDQEVDIVAFSADSRFLVTGGTDYINTYDLQKLEFSGTLENTKKEIYVVRSLAISGDQIFEGSGKFVINKWDLKSRKFSGMLGDNASIIKDIILTPDNKSLVLVDDAFGKAKFMIKKFRLSEPGITNAEPIQHDPRIQFSKDGKYIIAGGYDPFQRYISLVDPSTLNSNYGVFPNTNFTSVSFSASGKELLCLNSFSENQKLYIFDFPAGNLKGSVDLGNQKGTRITTLVTSKDGETIFMASNRDESSQKINQIIKAKYKNGSLEKSTVYYKEFYAKTDIQTLLLNADESLIIGVDLFGGMQTWNVETGDKLAPGIGATSKIISVKNKPASNSFFGSDENGNLNIYDFASKKISKTILGTGGNPIVLAPLANSNYIFSANDDRSVNLWDITKDEVAATMVFFGEKDWVIVNKTGLFEGTKDGMKKMYYVKGLEAIPLESGFEKFYTPGLLKSLMAGEKPAPPPIDINTLKSPPLVTISYSEGARNLVVEDDSPEFKTTNGVAKIEVNASCPADAVTEIRLYQNGKLVGGTRNLVVEDDVAASPKMTKTFTVNLLPGANTFKAIALNTQRTESKPMALLVNYTAPQNDVPVTSNITLHMLVVGINKYKNPKYNLNYAQADAEAFKDKIAGGSQSLFAASEITYLSNDQATQAGIAAAFEKIKNVAKPQDLFIFYYAGHGVINDKKEFFLVPFDVTQLYGNDEALAQKGFSAATLQQWSKDIKAQKQLFILDACQSAGALSQVAGSRGAAEEKAIAQLARSTGTQWLTASGSEQFAAEFESLGHGSFTYCILQALGGAANTGNQLTVKQLDAYLQTKVPEVTEKYKGTPQYPASYSYGNDFPIYIFK